MIQLKATCIWCGGTGEIPTTIPYTTKPFATDTESGTRWDTCPDCGGRGVLILDDEKWDIILEHIGTPGLGYGRECKISKKKEKFQEDDGGNEEEKMITTEEKIEIMRRERKAYKEGVREGLRCAVIVAMLCLVCIIVIILV